MSLPDTIYWVLGLRYNVRVEERGDSVRYEAFTVDVKIPPMSEVRMGETLREFVGQAVPQ